MTDNTNILQIKCANCSTHITCHTILCSHVSEGEIDDDGHPLHYRVEYQIIQCDGCKEITYRTVIQDSDSYEYAYDENGDTCIKGMAVRVERFPDDPKEILKKLKKEKLYDESLEKHKNNCLILPYELQHILFESIEALRGGYLTLATIGFRTALEAILRERKITKGDLCTKIEIAARKGLIPKDCTRIFHAIRYNGNDSTHEVKAATKEQLDDTLKAINILLDNSFTLTKLQVREENSKGTSSDTSPATTPTQQS